MNNKNRLKNVINEYFDKERNYNEIQNRLNNSNNYMKYVLSVSCLIIVVIMCLLSRNNVQLKKEINIDSNNEIKINDYNVTNSSISNYVNTNNSNISNYSNVNIPYFEVLNNLNLPNDFDIKYEGKARVKVLDKKDKDYGKINNYEFLFRNSKNSRNIVIGISNENEPISSININDNSSKSIINNVELIIYKYNNRYIVKFSYKDYNFIIETTDIDENELINLLKSIIK